MRCISEKLFVADEALMGVGVGHSF